MTLQFKGDDELLHGSSKCDDSTQCPMKWRFPTGCSNYAVCLDSLDQLKVLCVQNHHSQNSFELYRVHCDSKKFWLVHFVASDIIGSASMDPPEKLDV